MNQAGIFETKKETNWTLSIPYWTAARSDSINYTETRPFSLIFFVSLSHLHTSFHRITWLRSVRLVASAVQESVSMCRKWIEK